MLQKCTWCNYLLEIYIQSTWSVSLTTQAGCELKPTSLQKINSDSEGRVKKTSLGDVLHGIHNRLVSEGYEIKEDRITKKYRNSFYTVFAKAGHR